MSTLAATHTIASAAAELTRRMTPTTERELRQWLLAKHLIYRDLSGDHLVTARADARHMRTQYGYYPKPMPGNPYHQKHRATVKITDAGLDWLDAQLTATSKQHDFLEKTQ